MKRRPPFVLLFFLVKISLVPQADPLKPRNIDLTDASLTRRLAYADMFAGTAFLTAEV